MSQGIPTPFSTSHEETQFMDHYSEMTGQAQYIIIAILFLVILAGIVILRDMLKTAGESQPE